MKISIGSGELAYEDHGIGQPVLFLHAFPLNHMMWEGQISALLDEQRYRLVAPDWRGFGESTLANDATSTMELFADDLATLMDTLGMQQAVLCGLSMGGYVAFAFQHKYPERVSGLILADTRPGADSDEAKANRAQLASIALRQGTDAVADLQLPKLLSDYTRQHHPEVELLVRNLISAATPQGIAAASRGMAQRADFTSSLSQIACPTLVVVGENDVLTAPELARTYAQQIPNARFAVIPHAGHLSNLENPLAFYEAIHSFLASLYV